MQEKEFILVSGRFATGFLNRRIVLNRTTLYGDLGAALEKLINENLIAPTDNKRKIDGISYASEILGIPVNTQTTYRNLMNAVTGFGKPLLTLAERLKNVNEGGNA